MNDKNSFPSDGELFRAFQTGDEAVRRDIQGKLVEKYSEKLNKVISSYLRRKNCNQPAVHVKGVLSETWIDVFGNLNGLKDHDKFEHWSTIVGLNAANRHLKSCIGDQNTSEQITEDSLRPRAQIFNYYSSKDAAIDADRMLVYAYRISEEFGSIFRLYNEEELGFAEIADILGKHEDAVRTQYYRGFRKLKARFNKEDH